MAVRWSTCARQATGSRSTISAVATRRSTILCRYPVDRIKIAQSFVADIGAGNGADAIIRAALGLARELDIEVVVEGVESFAQLELLKAWGCRIVQGFYYSRPLPAAEMTSVLLQGSISPRRADQVDVSTPRPAPEIAGHR